MSAGDYTRKVETLGAIAARQSILTAPLREAIDEQGEGHLVESVTNYTPFGAYLMGWNELDVAVTA